MKFRSRIIYLVFVVVWLAFGLLITMADRDKATTGIYFTGSFGYMVIPLVFSYVYVRSNVIYQTLYALICCGAAVGLFFWLRPQFFRWAYDLTEGMKTEGAMYFYDGFLLLFPALLLVVIMELGRLLLSRLGKPKA